MTTTKSSAASTSARILQPEQSSQTLARPVTPGDSITSSYQDPAGIDVLNRFSEKFLPSDITIDLEGYDELTILEQFLGRHVKPAGIRDVQCMLLWSEWVRTFRGRTSGFPKLIREKEFREVITGTFDTDIAHRGHRGEVYTGIKYVP